MFNTAGVWKHLRLECCCFFLHLQIHLPVFLLIHQHQLAKSYFSRAQGQCLYISVTNINVIMVKKVKMVWCQLVKCAAAKLKFVNSIIFERVYTEKLSMKAAHEGFLSVNEKCVYNAVVTTQSDREEEGTGLYH